jgi:hypothetical protein
MERAVSIKVTFVEFDLDMVGRLSGCAAISCHLSIV